MPTLSVEPNERVTFGIRHQDDDLLIVEKRCGLVTHPGVGHEHDTLLNGLFASFGARLQNLGDKRDYGLIHRLDKDTSGLLIVALSIPAYDRLAVAIRQREIAKFYWALTRNTPKQDNGIIRLGIAEKVNSVSKYTSERIARIDRHGKPAMTAYRVLQTSIHASLIEARPITGRLHQIRVHLDAIGCAILGDPRYGPKESRQLAPRLSLHAHRLKLAHPISGDQIDVHAAFPRDLRKTLSLLKLERPDLEPQQSADHSLQDVEELAGDEIGETDS